ncbi:MAG: hypothetical protein R3246_12315, partial [Acidimicrobiia bacterium]|nr:hypothetical protein [Acidimicrobiia bacterium]
RSTVGFLATNRQASSDDFGRFVGIDASIAPNDRWGFWSFGGVTRQSEATGSRDWAGGIGASWDTDIWHWGGRVLQFGEDFDPQSGFLLRRDFRQYSTGFDVNPRPDLAAVRNFAFGAGGTVFEDPDDGTTQSIATGANFLGARFESGDFFTLFYEHRFERLSEPFEIHPGVVLPARGYRWNQVGGVFESSPERPITGRALLITGGFFDGDRLTTDLELGWRPSRHFRSETSWVRNDVALSTGGFASDVLRQRFRVAITPDLDASALIQFNDTAEIVAANVRFNWIYRPGADLFLVLNQTWDAPAGPSGLAARDRRVIVKFTYLVRPG